MNFASAAPGFHFKSFGPLFAYHDQEVETLLIGLSSQCFPITFFDFVFVYTDDEWPNK